VWHRPPFQDVPGPPFADPDSGGDLRRSHRLQPRQRDPPPTIVVAVDGQPFVQLVDRQQAREPVLESVRFLADELDLARDHRPSLEQSNSASPTWLAVRPEL
jgi:hypothetical protein